MARKKQPSNHRRHSPLRMATYTDRRTSTAGVFDGELAMSILVDVHRTVGRLDRSVARLEEGQKRLEERQTKLETKVDLLDAKVDQLGKRMSHLESRFEHLEGNFEHLGGQFEKLDTKVDKLAVKVDSLWSWRTKIGGGVIALSAIWTLYHAVSAYVHFGPLP